MKPRQVKHQRKSHKPKTLDEILAEWEKRMEKFMVERFPTVMYYLTYLPEKPKRFSKKRIW